MRRSGSTLSALLILAASVPGARAQGAPWKVDQGGVAGPQVDATRAGVDVLRRGGNAADAAVAVGFTLAVAYPQAGNLGGGGFMVLRLDGKAYAVDYREMAPGAAGRDMYLDAKGDVIPGRSTVGHLASGVPGSVAGLGFVYDRFGSKKIPWKDLVMPAVRLAREGIAWLPREESTLAGRVRELRDGKFAGLPAFLRYFGKDGRPLRAGERLVQSELADTLERIANGGWKEFYTGKTADLIEAEMKRHGGLITKADLAAYEAKLREPVEGTYRGYRLISMPPTSSGGVCLIEMLNALEPFDLRALGFHTPKSVHLITEVEKRAYADRAYFLGDPDFVKVPVAAMADPAYAAGRMKTFDPAKATPSDSVAHGEVPGFSESNETTHYSILDPAGNAVACTTTLNDSYGAAVVVEGAGFLLNDEMDDFSAKPGVPNMFGLLGGEANAIRPRKRMLSSMTPTIVLTGDGRPFLVVGTPGGSTIITSVLQAIVNVIDFGMTVKDAVEAPRFHHQWKPPTIQFEAKALTDETVETLKAMGHPFQTRYWFWNDGGWRPGDEEAFRKRKIAVNAGPAVLVAGKPIPPPLAAASRHAVSHLVFARDPSGRDLEELKKLEFRRHGNRWFSREGLPGTAAEKNWSASPDCEFIIALEGRDPVTAEELKRLAGSEAQAGTLLDCVREGNLPEAERKALEEAGYRGIGAEFMTRGLGILQAIQIDPETGKVTGASDSRGIGAFLGTAEENPK